MSNSKHLLIVDDSKVSRMMISTIVKSQFPDWVINEASNSDEALDIASKLPIECFTVDYNMPGLNGLELIAQLRQKKPSAKYVLLTANLQAHIKEEAGTLNTECFNKPITELLVKQILDYFS